MLMERMEPADNDCDEHVGHKCKRWRRLQSDKDSYDSVKPPLQLSLAWLRQVPASLFKQTESIHNRFRIHGAVRGFHRRHPETKNVRSSHQHRRLDILLGILSKNFFRVLQERNGLLVSLLHPSESLC